MADELTDKQRRFVEEYLIDLNATQAAIRAGLDLIQCGKQAGYYVYLLIDSRTGQIFYVGKGKGNRYAAHVREWKTHQVVNPEKSRRIGDIVTSGAQVLAFCFANELSEESAFRIERSVIRAIGLPNLTNATPGQSTTRERAILEAEISLSRIKPFCAWRREAVRSESDEELYWKVIRELRYIASGKYFVDIAALGCVVI